ncbi:MAG: LPXTG cell wall anchor domain-containing protein, partial [Streptococcus mitis]|nr:LPXTG cell wall anchor domain-containing protein [Streptococcus mitis]
KYTPTVTPVTPEGTPAETTDIQGKEQNGKPEFKSGNPEVPMDDEVPATFEDGSTTKTIPGEGTYTVTPDGTVTFTPEKTFTGTGTGVTVKRVDKNGTPVTAKYTPTVTPVTPTAEDVKSTDKQGQTQTGKPKFTEGNPSVPMDDDVPATFEDGSTTKVIPGEGTYTVTPDGTVTFTPEKTFTGKGTGVTVKRVDKNGTPVTAKYTPTVTPVSPTAEPVTSIGNKGQTQTGKPVFTEGDNRVPMNDKVPATFEDGSTTKTIPGVGTYTVAADGTVTFTPDPEFTGTAPAVTVVREDVNGTKAQATYTPTVRPITKFVDKEGKEIPGYPTEDGENPKKDIPGYRFVETKKLPNGDVEHVYEKVTTPAPTPSPIPQPNPGKQNTTTWTDENGNPLKPSEPGSKEPGTIPGYEYVKTVTDPNGNIRHIFRKVEMPTPTPVEPTQPAQPVEPATPAMPEQPAKPEVPTTPAQPVREAQAAVSKETEAKRELPNTGTEDNASLAALGLLGVLSGFGLVARKKKED